MKVWDSVSKWQVLAAISTDDLDSQVDQAEINLSDAQTALQDLLDGYNLDLELLQEQAELDKLLNKQKTIDQDHALALIQINQTVEKDKLTISEKQKAYDEVSADYKELLSGSQSATADLALSSTMRDRNNKFQTAVYDIKSAINAIKITLDSYDQILNISSTYKYSNNENEIYIWAKAPDTKDQSKKLYQTIFDHIVELEKLYSNLEKKAISDISKEELIESYVLLKNIGSNMMSRWETNYKMFKESITTSSLTQTVVDKYADTLGTSTQSAWIKYIQSYTSLISTLANLDEDTSLPDKKRELDNANLALEQAKTQLEKDQLSISTTIVNQQKEKAELLNSIATSKRNISKITSWESLNESRIKQAKNALKQRQDALDSLLNKYDDYLLEANFDGVITEMEMQVGDNIDSNNFSAYYIYVENNNVLEMSLSVEQVDIIKLKIWMDVVVYLDAYSNQTYSWVITEISTIPTSAGGVATYPVSITFEKNSPDETILAGMWWNAKIITSQNKWVILVPNQAITRSEWKSVVSLYKNWTWINQEVEIWTSDENNTAILEWLSIWDKIRAMYISEEGLSSAWISTSNTPDANMMWWWMMWVGWQNRSNGNIWGGWWTIRVSQWGIRWW